MSLLKKDLDYMRYDRRLDANLNQVDFSNMEYQSDPASSVGCNDHAMIFEGFPFDPGIVNPAG